MTSTVAQNYEQLSFNGPELSQWRAQARTIIADQVATRQLTALESGATCLFDIATGTVYTLPSPVIGMQFEFATTVTITSGAAKIVTNLATEFIVGDLEQFIVGSATTSAVAANGTTHRSINGNGSTTGGVIGDRIRLLAISSTQWLVDGVQSCSGTLSTPFATS